MWVADHAGIEENDAAHALAKKRVLKQILLVQNLLWFSHIQKIMEESKNILQESTSASGNAYTLQSCRQSNELLKTPRDCSDDFMLSLNRR